MSSPHKQRVAAPVPRRKTKAPNSSHEPRVSSPLAHPAPDAAASSFTPTTANWLHQRRRGSYSTIETNREAHYNLDFPENRAEYARLLLDPASRFYARNRPRVLDLPSLLPYETESPRDRGKFLAHIVAHLYIAVRSLDIVGLLPITAKDLAQLKDLAGFSDVDLALETNLFEMQTQQEKLDEDEDPNYFSQEDDSADDYESDLDTEGEHSEDGELGDIQNDDYMGELTMQHKKSPRSAAVVGVRTWTQELLVWLKMKYDMPLLLRMALARVYYAICCCRGQHISLRTYVRTFELLTRNVDLLQQQGFVLPWEPLYDDLLAQYSTTDSLYEALEKKDMSLLLRLGERASSFFAPESLPTLFRLFGSKYSIPNASLVFWLLRILPPLFSADYQRGGDDTLDIRHYIPLLFYMWNKLLKSNGVDSHVTSLIGRIAMQNLTFLSQHPKAGDSFGKFGVFTEDQFTFCTNTLLNSLSINCSKFGSLKTKFFHGFSSVMIFSLNGASALESGGIMDQIETLLNAIESYVHPSNTGEWSRSIGKFIVSLTYQFHKRFNMEREEYGPLAKLPEQFKISDALVKRFVRVMLPLVRTGLQSKRNSAIEQYLNSLTLLAHMDTEQTLSHVLLDIYESLEGVISTHRVITALRCVDELTRYFAATPFYRVHLTRILAAVLPGIDSNDLLKTLLSLNVFASVANFVPIYDLTNGEGDPGLAMELTSLQLEYLQMKNIDESMTTEFLVDEETEIAALKSSTSAFKEVIKMLAQKIFTLLQNVPDPTKSSGSEKELGSILPKVILILIEAMSDDIFKTFRQEFVTFIMDNTVDAVVDLTSEIFGGLIKRDPEYIKELAPLLIDRIKEEINENGAGQGRGGSEIIPQDIIYNWNIQILSESIANAREYVIDLEHELLELSFFLMDNGKSAANLGGSYMFSQMLQATTKIRLKESRLISPQYARRAGIDEKCWGGFQFNPYRFSKENLTFDWFIPGDRELRFAVSTFKAHVSKALSNIRRVLNLLSSDTAKGNSLDLTDELRVNFLYLAFAHSGISYLFDPSFDEDIPKLGDHKFESIQQRLALLTQLRDLKSGKFSDRDESSVEDVTENLENIIKDIEGGSTIDFDVDTAQSDIDEAKLDELFAKKNSSDDSIELSDESTGRKESRSFRKSESPTLDSSARASPQLVGVDMSSMNPAITFRERKLYTSAYSFGDDIDTRRSHELYLQLHKTRNLVGKSLHYICKFILTHLSDNTILLRHLLVALNVWFGDVGRERIFGYPSTRISFSHVNELQNINKMRKPFTRIAFGSRIESYHLLRVALHATSRSMNDLDKVLIEDLVKLSCSTYLDVADSAQDILLEAMKRVNGSYGVVIRSTFRYLNKALQSDNHKQIETGLRIFDLKKIEARMRSEYSILPKYIELLHKCLAANNEEINETAQSLFKSICGSISAPKKVCLIEHNLIESIRPPDEYIDLEIKAVTLAKDRKRKVSLQKFQAMEDVVVEHEKTSQHWKTSLLNLSFLIETQSDYEVSTRADIFRLLTNAASSDHPVLAKLALKGMCKLFNKFQTLSQFDYDLKKAYDPQQIKSFLKIVDTRPHSGESYYYTWRKELQREDPTYFIDARNNYGWLFWDDEMAVVSNDSFADFNFNDNDESIVKNFSDIVTREWFLKLAESWVTENDATFSFHGTDVHVTVAIVMLISKGYTKMLFGDLLGVVSEIYEKDDKSAHVVVCEIVLGILLALKNFNPDLVAERDEFLTKFLRQVLEHDLNPETKGIWIIFAWWVPAQIDCRRFPQIRDVILDFQLNKDSDSALMEASMLNFIRCFVVAITWATPNPGKLLDMCFNNINNRYEAVREQVGGLIAVVSFTFYSDSFGDFSEFLEATHGEQLALRQRNNDNEISRRLPVLFEQIEQSRKLVEDQLAQEILKSDFIYAATTVLSWLKQALNTSTSLQYQDMVHDHIAPLLLNLLAMKEVCILGNIRPMSVFKMVAQINFDETALENVVGMLEKYSTQNLNVVQFFAIRDFAETVYFRNLFKLTSNQRSRILNLTNSLMYHKNAEIREALSVTFSGLIHTTPPNEIEGIVNSFKTKYSKDLDRIRKKYKKLGFQNIDSNDCIILHGATLGLGALIHAFTFVSPPPPWIPQILTILSNKSSGIPGIVGKSAKETLGKFKKSRQDTWHVDSKVFTEEQLQDLEGVLWKSYFI